MYLYVVQCFMRSFIGVDEHELIGIEGVDVFCCCFFLLSIDGLSFDSC